MDEFAVGQIIQSGSGIDSGNPELSKIPLAHSAIAIRIHQGFVDGVCGGTKQFASAAAKTFGQLQHFFATSSGLKSAFYSHFFYLVFMVVLLV
jgi:hypothetical protein